MRSGVRSPLAPIIAFLMLANYMVDIKSILSKSAALTSALTIDELLKMLMDTAAELTEAEAGSVLLLDKPSGELVFAVATGEGGAKLSDIRIPQDKGIAGWVAKTGKSALVHDVSTDERHIKTIDRDIGFRTKSLLAVPMTLGGKLIGVLEAVNKRNGEFDTTDLNILSAFADLASVAISNTRRFEQLKSENKELREQAFGKWELVGKSPAIKKLREIIARVAPTSTTILITGESGTGKEVVARQIHEFSPRADKPFVKVSCAAIPETLLESELFGHEKGAFTGAHDRHIGRFEAATGSSILLDEIGEITQSVQTKLLRVLQEKEFERLGSNKTLTTDVRVIAATNRDLRKSIESGAFREDLFYRLNIIPIEVPPLRDHVEDIPLLIENFLKKLSAQFPHNIREVDKNALDLMMSYYWPGNVRELENLIERCAVISNKSVITVDLLPPEIFGGPRHSSVENISPMGGSYYEVEEALIRQALKIARGNVSEAARNLKLSRDRFRYRLKRYNIDPEKYR